MQKRRSSLAAVLVKRVRRSGSLVVSVSEEPACVSDKKVPRGGRHTTNTYLRKQNKTKTSAQTPRGTKQLVKVYIHTSTCVSSSAWVIMEVSVQVEVESESEMRRRLPDAPELIRWRGGDRWGAGMIGKGKSSSGRGRRRGRGREGSMKDRYRRGGKNSTCNFTP